jgi:hypothetical protein
MGYTAAFFRHKESLKYPSPIPAYWLPFSIDKDRYERNIIKNISKKEKKVGFIGAAHNSARELYSQRIAAIDYLISKKMLNITEVLDSKFNRKILLKEEYVKFLTKNMFNLTCGGTSNYFTAKYIQIPAAYSMLVCSKTNGLELYPKDTYIEYDVNNLEELYNNLNYHINNLNITNEKINTLFNFIIKNYNHTNNLNYILKILDF